MCVEIVFLFVGYVDFFIIIFLLVLDGVLFVLLILKDCFRSRAFAFRFV